MLASFLAVLTKEMAVGLILLFPLYEFLIHGSRPSLPYPPPRGGREGWGWQHIGVILLIPLAILGLYFSIRTLRITSPYGHAPLSTFFSSSAVSEVIEAYGYYLKILVFPYPHNPFLSALPTSPWALILSALAMALLFGGFLFALFRRQVFLGIGLAWTLLLLAPAVALPILHVGTTPVAERYVYAPSAGFLIGIVWLILKGLNQFPAAGWPLRKIYTIAGLIFIMIVSVGGWESWKRNAVWRSRLTFWQTAVDGLPGKTPKEAIAHNNLGNAYHRVRRLQEAIKEYELALKLRPGSAKDHNRLGATYAEDGLLNEAIREFQTALKIDPKNPEIHANLGIALTQQGRRNEAIEEFQRALQINPDYEKARQALQSLTK